MATTPKLGLDEMTVSQSGKYLTFNEAIKLLEIVRSSGLVSRATSKPGSPTDGDAYIVPNASPNTWTPIAIGSVAVYRGTEWVEVTAIEGLGPFWVNDENKVVCYDGSAWSDITTTTISNGIEALTTAEVDQLENIGSTTISAAQWGYVGGADQALKTSDTPTFAGINLGNENLNDYDEGTFTPELWDSSLQTESPQPNYTVQVGQYIKIGKIVHAYLRLRVSALGGLTTSEPARIGALPFTSKNVSNGQQAVSVGFWNGVSLGSTYAITGYVNPATTYLSLRLTDSASATTDLLVSEFSASGDVIIQATYFTD